MTPISPRSASPSVLQAFFEREPFPIKADQTFLESLSEYLKEVDTAEDGAKEFCDELKSWLRDPNTKNADPLSSLKMWQEKIDDLDDASTMHFPRIEIIKTS